MYPEPQSLPCILSLLPLAWDALTCPSQQPCDFPLTSGASGPFGSPGSLRGGDKSRLVGVMGCLLCSAWLCSALRQVRGWGCAQVSWARGNPRGQWERWGQAVSSVRASTRRTRRRLEQSVLCRAAPLQLCVRLRELPPFPAAAAAAFL